MTDAPNPLFRPLQLGPLTLPNRVLMAPMTRSRSAQPGDVPRELNARYYAQRSSAGLIFTEATQVSPQGKGYAYTPGIHSDAQVEGWRAVTDAIHANGGRVVLQLWHVGRMSHVDIQQDGQPPVSASALNAGAQVYLGDARGMAPTSDPRALETDEIAGVVEQFRQGAQRAKDAGFDGVELHGANGYLIEQFLCAGSNVRTDRYGGSIPNRIRFAVETLEALIDVWGADRVGMRISPGLGFGGTTDPDPQALYAALVAEANRLQLPYLDVVEYMGAPGDKPAPNAVHRHIREVFKGLYLANGGYTQATAAEAIASGHADAVLFGKPFISNPDLPERFRRSAPLAAFDPRTFYGGDAGGYSDYPALGWALDEA